jgi:hypothetical protein
MTSKAQRSPRWLRDKHGARLLRYAAAFYAVAWFVHTADHLRRGFGVVTGEVTALGTGAAVLQLAAIALVFRRHRLAPLAAVAVGIPDGIGIAAVHLLPRWSVFSDAFPGAHGTGVTALSWVAAILEVVGALVFAAAGAYVLRRTQWGAGDDANSAHEPAVRSAPADHAGRVS